jgi:hypothetical protein
MTTYHSFCDHGYIEIPTHALLSRRTHAELSPTHAELQARFCKLT